MKLIIQKVTQASVEIDNTQHSSISKGILIYLGISNNCSDEKINWCVDKLLSLRIFEENGKGFQKTIEEINGEILVVSQFTLFGDCSEGTKPKFNLSANYFDAKGFYDEFISLLKQETNCSVKTGEFGANMNITSTNEGPVTLVIEK